MSGWTGGLLPGSAVTSQPQALESKPAEQLCGLLVGLCGLWRRDCLRSPIPDCLGRGFEDLVGRSSYCLNVG